MDQVKTPEAGPLAKAILPQDVLEKLKGGHVKWHPKPGKLTFSKATGGPVPTPVADVLMTPYIALQYSTGVKSIGADAKKMVGAVVAEALVTGKFKSIDLATLITMGSKTVAQPALSEEADKGLATLAADLNKPSADLVTSPQYALVQGTGAGSKYVLLARMLNSNGEMTFVSARLKNQKLSVRVVGPSPAMKELGLAGITSQGGHWSGHFEGVSNNLAQRMVCGVIGLLPGALDPGFTLPKVDMWVGKGQ
jgi:hypothetical protein